MLSLASNTNCMLMDDELNILPISSHVRDGMKPIPLKEDGTPNVPGSSEAAAELKELTESLRDVQARSITCRIFLRTTSNPSCSQMLNHTKWEPQG